MGNETSTTCGCYDHEDEKATKETNMMDRKPG